VTGRVLCPTSATWLGRHMVTDRRWTITTPDGLAVTLCSVACVITWACHSPGTLMVAGNPHGDASAAPVVAGSPGTLMTTGNPHNGGAADLDTVLRRDTQSEAAA
jgi:hypothetical protein